MCTCALRMAGVQFAVYGCSNERFGGCGSVIDAHEKHCDGFPPLKIVQGVCSEKAVQLFQEFYERGNPRGNFHKHLTDFKTSVTGSSHHKASSSKRLVVMTITNIKTQERSHKRALIRLYIACPSIRSSRDHETSLCRKHGALKSQQLDLHINSNNH
eukprot:Selendium_serpulae@DN5831_c1_g1_i1.p1